MMDLYCPVCGVNSRHQNVFKKNNYSIVRCQECSMVHCEPMPTPEQAKAFYQTGGLAAYSDEYIEQKIHNNIIENRFKVYSNAMVKYAKKGDSVLDIGCHDGTFLKVLKNVGFEVYGQEVCEKMAEAVFKKRGISTSSKEFLELEMDKKMNFISALSVIEHIPNMEDFLKKIHNLLAPKGFFLVEVPNVDCYESKVIHYFLNSTLGYWFEPTPPIHLWEFNKNTIQLFLNRMGFRIVELETFTAFECGEETAKYPEGYFIAREGLDCISLESEKRKILQSIKGNEAESYESVLLYIGKCLAKKVFEETKIFSEVTNNKTCIWVLAQKM